ncbi:MAG: HAD-IIA family hydrolase [Arcobacteraceae bacterium]
MNIIILAAGIGSRLRPLTHTKPKGMIRVNGIPIIEHQIKAYLNAGIPMSKISIAVGYKSKFINDFINSNYPEINIITNKDYDNTNNMYSLHLCLSKLDEDITIVSNGDCVYDYEIIKEFISSNLPNSVACDKGSFTDENMKVIVENNKILHISKQIEKEKAYGNSIDLYKIDKKSIPKLKSIISEILTKDLNLWSELALDQLFDFIDFYPFDIQQKNWMEIDNYDDLYDAEKKFSKFSLKDKKALIFDLDGTIYLGNKPIQGTIDFIINHCDKYDIYYMTNNTSKNLRDYVDRLNKLNLNTSIEKIISPLLPLIDFLKTNKIFNIFLVGNENLKKYLIEQIPNITFTDDERICQAVVCGYDTELTYEKLKNASLLLKNKNIKFIATHKDIVCPTEKGNIPDIGAMLKLLELTVDRKPTSIFGKPNPVLLNKLLSKFTNNEMVIIGDRVYTDKLLANNANIDFILVLSGETKREDIEDLQIFPELILKDCSELN